MKNAVSQTYLCCSETWRLQALGIASFVILTPVVNVPVHKEVFPTAEWGTKSCEEEQDIVGKYVPCHTPNTWQVGGNSYAWDNSS